jgi:hypothetical protein
MPLNDAIESDASRVFTSTSDFAEAVTYKPLRKQGDTRAATRSINAVVFRESLLGVTEDGGETVAPMFEVHVCNSATLGISSTELDCGGDQISFPVRPGMSASYRAIIRLITQDEGMLVLECR